MWTEQDYKDYVSKYEHLLVGEFKEIWNRYRCLLAVTTKEKYNKLNYLLEQQECSFGGE